MIIRKVIFGFCYFFHHFFSGIDTDGRAAGIGGGVEPTGLGGVGGRETEAGAAAFTDGVARGDSGLICPGTLAIGARAPEPVPRTGRSMSGFIGGVPSGKRCLNAASASYAMM